LHIKQIKALHVALRIDAPKKHGGRHTRIRSTSSSVTSSASRS
jgi:hypothetical protein